MMESMKAEKVISFAGSLIATGVGYVLENSYQFGLCVSVPATQTYDVACHVLYSRIGDPLFYGSAALALIFIALLFAPAALGAWKKFAVWFVPLAALLFIFYPDPSQGDLFSPRPVDIFRWVSILYVVVSAAIILAASRKKA